MIAVGCGGIIVLYLMFLNFVAGLRVAGGGLMGDFQGEVPPVIESQGTWLNAEGPLTLSELRGQVVWLEFSFLH
jgi:hypothetical protein